MVPPGSFHSSHAVIILKLGKGTIEKFHDLGHLYEMAEMVSARDEVLLLDLKSVV